MTRRNTVSSTPAMRGITPVPTRSVEHEEKSGPSPLQSSHRSRIQCCEGGRKDVRVANQFRASMATAAIVIGVGFVRQLLPWARQGPRYPPMGSTKRHSAHLAFPRAVQIHDAVPRRAASGFHRQVTPVNLPVEIHHALFSPLAADAPWHTRRNGRRPSSRPVGRTTRIW